MVALCLRFDLVEGLFFEHDIQHLKGHFLSFTFSLFYLHLFPGGFQGALDMSRVDQGVIEDYVDRVVKTGTCRQISVLK